MGEGKEAVIVYDTIESAAEWSSVWVINAPVSRTASPRKTYSATTEVRVRVNGAPAEQALGVINTVGMVIDIVI
jgi:hypothetical protein